MSLFSSLVPIAGQLIGSALGKSQEQRGADAAFAAQRTIIPPELRAAFERAGRFGDQQLGAFKRFNRGGLQAMEARELSRLQDLRAPSIEAARTRLQGQLLNRGRLGLGRGGGRTGGLFNPETAALEEAILQSQLGDIGAARSMAVAESNRLLSNARGLFNIADPLIERPNPGIAAMQATPYFNQAEGTRGFFSGLGQSIFTGLGGGGGGFNLPANGLGAGNPGR